MALLGKNEIRESLTRLGQLAAEQEIHINLLLLGGALMALRYDARETTRDIDVLIREPQPIQVVRKFAKTISMEKDWPDDWLNDAAKAFLIGESLETIVFEAPGITIWAPAVEQLLAMKLSAWRDDVDISDAQRLLKELPGDKETIWTMLSPHLYPGTELKAKYALDDLWENYRDDH